MLYKSTVLLAHEVSATEIAKLDETQYGRDIGGIVKSVLTGAVVGALGSGITGGDPEAVVLGAVGGAVIGGALSAISGSRKKKLLAAQQATKFFSFITDIELRERAIGTVTRSSKTEVDSNQASHSSDSVEAVSGGSGNTVNSTETETYTEQSTWKRHRTRMIGKAKGKLVVFEDVEQDFALKMARAIAGLF